MNSLTKISLLLLLFGCFTAFVWTPDTVETKEEVKWYSWEEAIEANKKEKRQIMIDIYTGWCGWCKVMDKKTFNNGKVAAYLNKHFYPVKLDAEQRQAIKYDSHTFEYMKGQRGRGVHALAYSLLDGQMSYPSIVFMDQDVKRIMISKGFKDAKDFMEELEFVATNAYKSKSFKEFQREGR